MVEEAVSTTRTRTLLNGQQRLIWEEVKVRGCVKELITEFALARHDVLGDKSRLTKEIWETSRNTLRSKYTRHRKEDATQKLGKRKNKRCAAGVKEKGQTAQTSLHLTGPLRVAQLESVTLEMRSRLFDRVLAEVGKEPEDAQWDFVFGQH